MKVVRRGVSAMVRNPLEAYGALLVVIVAAACALFIMAGFVAPDVVIDGNLALVYVGAVVVMSACAVVSWLVDLPGILRQEFGGGR